MKILVDENIPAMCVAHLQQMGHDIADIRGTAEEGVCDARLRDKAQKENRLLITTDKGFARRRYMCHRGILIVLLRQPNRQSISQRVIEAMHSFPAEKWRGLLVVMRDTVMSTWRTPVGR